MSTSSELGQTRIELWDAQKEIERLQKRNALLEDVAAAADELNYLNQRRTIEPFDFRHMNAALAKLRED